MAVVFFCMIEGGSVLIVFWIPTVSFGYFFKESFELTAFIVEPDFFVGSSSTFWTSFVFQSRACNFSFIPIIHILFIVAR